MRLGKKLIGGGDMLLRLVVVVARFIQVSRNLLAQIQQQLRESCLICTAVYLGSYHARAGYETHDVEVVTRTIDSILEEAGWSGSDIHFMSVDTEGSERDVLEGIDFGVWRPWILVVEATAPLSTEPTRKMWEDLVLDAGYRFCLFDGVSCYYVAEERAASLGGALGYPACAHDDFTTREYREATQERQELAEKVHGIPELVEQVTRWRAQAVNRWATAIATRTELERVRAELEDLLVTIQEVNDATNEERVELYKLIAGLRTRSTSCTSHLRGESQDPSVSLAA